MRLRDHVCFHHLPLVPRFGEPGLMNPNSVPAGVEGDLLPPFDVAGFDQFIAHGARVGAQAEATGHACAQQAKQQERREQKAPEPESPGRWARSQQVGRRIYGWSVWIEVMKGPRRPGRATARPAPLISQEPHLSGRHRRL
jgi:hypothetical protein